MTPSNRKRNRQRRPARAKPFKQPKRRLLVSCEGERTEPEYLRGFLRHTKNVLVDLKIPNEHGDPKKVVEIAKAATQAARSKARAQNDEFLSYDQTWCVFDRDEHPRFDPACIMAEDNGYELAVSNPCFELWLLLHFRDSPGDQPRDRILTMLKKHVPDYDKGIAFTDFVAGIDDAVRRARQLDEAALKMGEKRRNPTTGVYRLVQTIGGNK